MKKADLKPVVFVKISGIVVIAAIIVIFIISLFGYGVAEPSLTAVQNHTETPLFGVEEQHSEVGLGINLQLTNVSENEAEIIEEIKGYSGLDFSEPMIFSADITSHKNISYGTYENLTRETVTESYKSENDSLTEFVSSMFTVTNDKQFTAAYENIQNNIVYFSPDWSTWYSRRQTPIITYEQAAINQESLADDIVAFIGQEKTTINRERSNGYERKIYTYSFNFSREFYNSLSVERAGYLKSIAEVTLADFDFDEFLDALAEYSKYADIEIPVSLSVIYEKRGGVYLIDECIVDVNIKASVNISPEELKELVLSTYDYGLTGTIRFHIMTSDRNYNKGHSGYWPISDSYETSEGFKNATPVDNDTKLPVVFDYENYKFYYVLKGATGLGIFNFSQDIRKWNIDEELSLADGTKYIFRNNEENELIICSTIPDAIAQYYTEGTTNGIEYIDSIVTEYNPYGYNLFRYDGHLYAVYYGEDFYNSVVLDLNYTDKETELDTLISLVNDYF